MPLVTRGRNDLLTAGLTAFGFASAFTGDPNTGHEVAGGVYARQPVAWNAASGGIRTSSGALTVPVPGGNTVKFIGIHDALSGGNLEGYVGVGASLAYGSAAVTGVDDTLRSMGHGLVDTNQVHVWAAFGAALPTGFSAGVAYFVVSASTDTFQLALTSGGSPIPVSDGDLGWQQTKPDVFGSDGTLPIPDQAFVIDATAF